MKNRMTAILLTLCLALSLAACLSSGSAESSQAQKPSVEEGENSDSELSDDVLAKMTDEQREKYEEYLEFKKQKEERNASTEVNAYGITDEALQSLIETIREKVTDDYLNVYNIPSSDFSWPETETMFWNVTSASITLALNVGSFESLPVDQYSKLSDEETALAKALLSGIAAWEDRGGGKFFRIASVLNDRDKVVQFFLDNVTFE